MKSWQLLIVTSAVAGFLYLAVYAYHHRHDGDRPVVKSSVARPVILHRGKSVKFVTVSAYDYLYADDGQQVDQQIKVTEWARARKTMGR